MRAKVRAISGQCLSSNRKDVGRERKRTGGKRYLISEKKWVTKTKLENHESFAIAFGKYTGQELTTEQIAHILLRAYPNFSLGSIRPNDHASGNKSPCSCAGTANRVFDRLDRGLYRVRAGFWRKMRAPPFNLEDLYVCGLFWIPPNRYYLQSSPMPRVTTEHKVRFWASSCAT